MIYTDAIKVSIEEAANRDIVLVFPLKYIVFFWIIHTHMQKTICPVFDPEGWRAFANTTCSIMVILALQAEDEVQSELELLRKFRGILGSKDEGRAAKQRWLGKGWRRQPRQELNALQHRLQVHQSPSKLKARWGLGFTSHFWHQSHIRRQ